MLVLSENDCEHSVASARALVHVGRGNCSRLVPLLHEVVDVLVVADGQLAQVLHVGAQEGVLSHPQVPLAVGIEKVSHPLAVYFHVAHLCGSG